MIINKTIIKKILNVDDYYFNVFMSISESLTGFTVNELQSTGLAEIYYKYILAQMEAPTFIEFLNISKMILENSYSQDTLNHSIVSEIMVDPGMRDMASHIITMWYLGTWEGTYVNGLSYKEGLVWNIMHANPPGAKQPGFKSWSVKPVKSNA
ncbi:MAG TPA: hypothetical protein VN040_27850 [Pseudosphingobacterium sp.]|nr:hypothetical protein [Pseudosphingobacterium sp.]